MLLEVKDKLRLSSKRSEKEVFHISLSAQDLKYMPGDILKIYPKNDPNVIEEIERYIDRDIEKYRGTKIEKYRDIERYKNRDVERYKDRELSREKLDRFDLKSINRKLIERYSESSDYLKELLLPTNFFKLRNFILERRLSEFLEEFSPIKNDDISDLFKNDDISDLLSPMLPRSYSISSSLKKHPNELHMMVGMTTFKTKRGLEKGVASSYLIDRVDIGDRIRCELKEHPNFRLPEEDRDLIMIGAGTGLAPFISFLQEREDSSSKKWLIFGEQRRSEHFYYEDYLTDLKSRGKLDLDLAFSRDGSGKYVQDTLIESEERFKKMVANANIYVCGSREMAHEVNRAILHILRYEDSPKDTLHSWKISGKYRVDAY